MSITVHVCNLMQEGILFDSLRDFFSRGLLMCMVQYQDSQLLALTLIGITLACPGIVLAKQ